MVSRRSALITVCLSVIVFLSSFVATGSGAAAYHSSSLVSLGAQQRFASLAQVEAAVTASRGISKLPSSVAAQLGAAAIDDDRDVTGVCFLPDADASSSKLSDCTYGNQKAGASKTVVIFGDSLANMWFPAIETLAIDHGFKVILLSEANCPVPTLTFFDTNINAPSTACNTWRAAEVKEIDSLKPERIYVASSGLGDEVVVNGKRSSSGDFSAWTAAFVRTIDAIRKSGAAITLIGNPPYIPLTAPNCLAAHLTSVQSCGSTYAQAFADSRPDVEQTAAKEVHISFVNSTELFCSPPRCSVVINNMVVYRDPVHATATYVKYLTGALGTLLHWPAIKAS